MKKYYFYLVVAFITVGAGFFASTSPDGLDFVSGKLGFAIRAKDSVGLMPDYSISLLGDGSFSTIISGFVGVLIIAIFFSMVKIFYLKKEKANV